MAPYISTTLENLGFIARSFAKSKRAYCLGRLVRVCDKKIIKPFTPELFKEPFAVENGSVTSSCALGRGIHTCTDPAARSTH